MNFPLSPAEADVSPVDNAEREDGRRVDNGANGRSFCLQIAPARTHSRLWIPSR